jgi:hypothetical protein
MPRPEEVWLGSVDRVAGYEWLVAGNSEEECWEALRAELRRQLGTGQVVDVWGDTDPMEYFGAYVRRLRVGEVEVN